MHDYIFCPVCTVNLSRVPSEVDITTSNMTAHFRHRKGFEDVSCPLRTTTAKGHRYDSRELALQAIQNDELSIIGDWLENPPEIKEGSENPEFDGAQLEDSDGEISEIPMAIHNGETFNVPSKPKSVFSLCKNLPFNLTRYYYFKNSESPVMLKDALVSSLKAKSEDFTAEYLYYGKIKNVIELHARNIIKIENTENHRINLFTYPEFDERRQIDKNSIGRTLLFHGQIDYYGGDPRIMLNRWGQYALLPSKYDRFLDELEKDL